MTEFVRIEHPDVAGRAVVPVGAMPAYQALGWEPVSEPRPYGELVDEETIRAQELAAEQESGQAEAQADGTVAQVLERVGDDPEAAEAALRVEQEKTQPRVTLVAELERIAGQANSESGEPQ